MYIFPDFCSLVGCLPDRISFFWVPLLLLNSWFAGALIVKGVLRNLARVSGLGFRV